MKMSELNGQHVDYKDVTGLNHSGVIVGLSEDHKWYHIKSDNPNAPSAEWHFRIRAGEISKYISTVRNS